MAEKRQVRICLWITPRSLSTAFLKCMSTFENAQLFQEPYFTASMFGPERTKNIPELEPVIENLEDVKHITFEWVKNTLEKEYLGKDLVFTKDGARSIYGHLDCLPQGYRHVFLIRKPIKVHVSIDKIKNCVHDMGVDKTSFSRKDPSFLIGSPHRNVLELLEFVRDEFHEEPVVIDAEDLMISPSTVIKKFCEIIGLEYSDKMLSWRPGPDPRWQRAESVQTLFAAMTSAHDNAYSSTGFQIRAAGNLETEISVSDLDDDVRKLVEDSTPYYERLKAMAITIDDDN